MAESEIKPDDSLPASYQPSELKIASEFLTTWLPFLSKDLCHDCSRRLSDRVRSIGTDHVGDEPSDGKFKTHEIKGSEHDNCDSKSVGSDEAETNSLGSWKDDANEKSETPPESGASPAELAFEAPCTATPGSRMSWADMAQEDELEEEEEECGLTRRVVDVNSSSGKLTVSKVVEKPTLPREQREYIRFTNVGRKKNFICLERVKGKIVNILDGLELHTGVFSAAEQKRIVDYIHLLQEKGRKGELRERTFSAPRKWMKGKGRVTIQFGCCYNYATDKNGNPPGILQNENVDPIPYLFKVIIRRLVKWHVLPPSCVPDSCIVNIYDEGDCIPPHIDNHDFVRPFCTVSFLSECDIILGSNLEIIGPGEFSGPASIPLPIGSVLVLNGNGADVAKHCVPAVPSKRISITFRRMDESKRPAGFVPEQDLQGIQPLPYNTGKIHRLNSPRSENDVKRQSLLGRGDNQNTRGYGERYDTRSEPRDSARARYWPSNRRRMRVNSDS